MKRQYITPSVFCVKLDPKRTFLNSSPYEQSEKEVMDGEGGWAREDNNNTDENNNRNSVWDNIW